MRKWPRGAYIAILLLILIATIAIAIVYNHTRAAYHAVGFNDGQIQQREKIIETIQRSVTIAECGAAQQVNEPVEFLTVKDDSLYLIPGDGKTVAFCR